MGRTVLSLLIFFFTAWSYADENVVARVNSAVITSRDLEAAVDRLIPRATYHGSIPEEKRNEFRGKALEDLINQELQYQDALAKGMKPDKKSVKTRLEQIRDRYKTKAEYKAALERAGITDDELRTWVERANLIQVVLAKTVTEPARTTEAMVKDYHDKNTAKFKQPESVKLRMISIKDEKKAKDILTKIRAGEDFGDLAARMSEDDYRIKGGDIGYIHRGRIYPELEEAAFKLKLGEVSGLLKSQGMWFIIKVEDKEPEHQVKFEDIKSKLKKDLEDKRAAELLEKWIVDLRTNAKIEVLIKTQ